VAELVYSQKIKALGGKSMMDWVWRDGGREGQRSGFNNMMKLIVKLNYSSYEN